MTKKYFDTNSDDDVVIVVDSVDIVMFLLYPYCMFVEGGIMSHIGFVGVLDYSVFVKMIRFLLKVV